MRVVISEIILNIHKNAGVNEYKGEQDDDKFSDLPFEIGLFGRSVANNELSEAEHSQHSTDCEQYSSPWIPMLDVFANHRVNNDGNVEQCINGPYI